MATIISSALVLHLSSPFTITPTPTASSPKHALPFLNSLGNRRIIGLIRRSHRGILGEGQGACDPDLRPVLELATNSELYELERILFGPSYFSPLLKSVTGRRVDVDYAIIEEDLAEREAFIEALESRFLFLAADARSTLRGWRPSYRNVLLAVRKKLNIPCSRKLSTEDLEAEIFLHLVQDYSREELGAFPSLWESSMMYNDQGSLELGPRQRNGPALAALKLGLAELQSMILKSGGMFTLSRFYQLFASKLSGKVFLEAANYQVKKEIMKKGGQLAAINLESRAALLAAKQGFAGATSRYLGFRSMMSLLGPLMWGTFLADAVIQMLGTDYARILRAIYAFAEVAMCNFPTIKDAADVAIATMLSGIQVSRVELLDEVQVRAINIANGKNLPEVPTLMFEFIGTEAYAREQTQIVQEIVSKHNGSDFVFAEEPEAKKELWKIRKEALWACFAMEPKYEAMISDVCVPLSCLAELISRSKQELDASPLVCTVIAHAGDGNFHTVILFDPSQEEQRQEAERLNQFMVYTALSMEGTCTGEHGVGTGKMKYLEKELGVEALRTMKRIKTALDPNNIMNPGKLIPPHVCF